MTKGQQRAAQINSRNAAIRERRTNVDVFALARKATGLDDSQLEKVKQGKNVPYVPAHVIAAAKGYVNRLRPNS